MQHRELLPLLLLTAGLFMTACAVSPEQASKRQAIDADIDAILSEPLDEAEYGPPKRCLSDLEFRSYRALDDRHLLFEGRRDRLWVNKLRARCPDLRHGGVLIVRDSVSGNRLCEQDSFAVDDWFHWPWYRRWPWRWGSGWSTGMTCTLGKFQPVTEEQVKAIEELLDAS